MENIEKKIAEYARKLREKAEAEKATRAPIVEAANALLAAIADCPVGSIKRELSPVVRRLEAFNEGRAYCTRERSGK